MENNELKEYTVGEIIDYLSTKNREQKFLLFTMTDCFMESETKMTSSSYYTDKFIIGEIESKSYNEESKEIEKENVIVLLKDFSVDKNFACIKLDLLDEVTKNKIHKNIV